MPPNFPPPGAKRLDSFAMHVATLADGRAVVCIQADADDPPKFEVFQHACEYLMSVLAKESNAGYEATLDALVAAAMQCRTLTAPEAGDRLLQLKEHRFVVKRDGENTFGVIRAETQQHIVSGDQLRGVITAAVTDWIIHTEEGHAAWTGSCEDMNIADLAQHLDDPYLADEMSKRGIDHLSIDIQGGTQTEWQCTWTFDTHLFDAAAVEEAYSDEED